MTDTQPAELNHQWATNTEAQLTKKPTPQELELLKTINGPNITYHWPEQEHPID